jgi:hypothetical protein
VRSDCYVLAAQFDRFALDPVRCPNIGYITVYRQFAERMRDPTPAELEEYVSALLQPAVARHLGPAVRAAARHAGQHTSRRSALREPQPPRARSLRHLQFVPQRQHLELELGVRTRRSS